MTPIKIITFDNTLEDVKTLLEERRILAIDLQLTTEEKTLLEGLDINVEGSDGNFLYWGSVNNKDFSSNLKSYLATLGENDEKTVDTLFNLIVCIAKNITRYFDTEFAWIETKTFFANDTFITPRWHVDNKFFKPHTAHKFVWAAKGAQTRFGITTNTEEFNRLTTLEIEAGHGTEKNIWARKEINNIVQEVSMPLEGNAALYQSGGKDPFVHSEPHMSDNRLFIAIIPGSKEEILEWYERKRQKDTRKGVKERKWYYPAL